MTGNHYSVPVIMSHCIQALRALLRGSQLVQAGGEAGPVGLHGGEELAVGHVVNRDPADFHAFVVVCLGLDGVAGLFEGKHGGVGPRPWSSR